MPTIAPIEGEPLHQGLETAVYEDVEPRTGEGRAHPLGRQFGLHCGAGEVSLGVKFERFQPGTATVGGMAHGVAHGDR